MKKKSQENVTAVIELKITPAKDTGFAKIAQKIAKFPQVEACFLMSGAYDLLVFVNGASLQEVALFVSGQLSTIEGVLSTAGSKRSPRMITEMESMPLGMCS